MARLLLVALMLLLAAGKSSAQSRSSKPPVPPGRDPGGVAIAYIGPGVLYTLPEIASRLARDGEGELIGWDFIDNDRRPMEPCAVLELSAPTCATRRAVTLLKEAGPSRLIVVRATSDQPQSLVQAAMLVAHSPARIVLFAPAGREPLNLAFVADAARRLPRLLFVVPQPVQAATGVSLDNAIFVAAAGAGPPVSGADLVVPFFALAAPDGSATVYQHSEVATARVAALAARLLTVEPNLDAAALKRRIVGLATPLPAGSPLQSKHGLIEHPDRPFRPQ